MNRRRLEVKNAILEKKSWPLNLFLELGEKTGKSFNPLQPSIFVHDGQTFQVVGVHPEQLH